MPAFLEKLVAERAAIVPYVHRLVDDFVDQAAGVGDPWERRFAEKFGIVFAAAVLLAKFGIAPWTKERASIAIKAIYRRARNESASVDETANKAHPRLARPCEFTDKINVLPFNSTAPSTSEPSSSVAAKVWDCDVPFCLGKASAGLSGGEPISKTSYFLDVVPDIGPTQVVRHRLWRQLSAENARRRTAVHRLRCCVYQEPAGPPRDR